MASDQEFKIDIDFLDSGQLDAIRQSARELYGEMEKCSPKEGTWNCQELVWPALGISGANPDPKLLLVPLERVGGEQGFGGGKVMIGYFVDQRPGGVLPSRPMIVKISKAGEQKKLTDESACANQVRAYTAYQKDSFAVPICCREYGKHSVMWSPFASSEWVWANHKSQPERGLALGVHDLLRNLRTPNQATSAEKGSDEEILDAVYRTIWPLHRRAGLAKQEKRSVVAEYTSYLRGFTKNRWGKNLITFWTTSEVNEFGNTYFNPIQCLKQLELIEEPLYCGAVHGDLHPRNIVLTDSRIPHIIDFGWAKDNAHIAKDFVLLECNLRFNALSSDVRNDDLDILTDWIEFGTEPREPQSEYIARRFSLIRKLRENAGAHFPDKTNWDIEYIVPMFLTAFGLLKVLHSVDNQIAARLTVLKLANYLRAKLTL